MEDDSGVPYQAHRVRDITIMVDTVGFLRALLNPFGPWGAIIFDLGEFYELIVSDELEAECTEVLSRPELARRMRPTKGRDFDAIKRVLRQGTRVRLQNIPRISRDPSDDYLIEMARIGAAKFIVTEDKDLLSIGDLGGILFITGRGFLDLLAELSPE